MNYELALLVLSAGDDFVLQLLRHIVEIVRIACYAHQQIAVVVRMLLGIEQRLGIHDVELYMVAAELEIGADEAGTFLYVFVALEKLWCKANVKQRSAALRLVEFAE